ncbi:tRNA (adenosine(37)-N6)-threonylcarbamoyltransferase complex dimerization subunit type 1 TsaB [Mesorhizobium sp. CAU 1741]|uniref:tRNA (adenosine(37)-N6)-threonylcarbamoyltransferase complex dimerization subunit type 1 TsaB n=1 Tax=Mesorhizobium sp. CAU 1741 TaxID=3140366 RepID=UPI00325B20B5
MRILAIDTAAALCAACVYDTQAGELGRQVLDLGKGHAERLMGVIDAALANAGTAYADIDAIAVSVGPGSFTGVRVGVATARGLALALKRPAIGISTLEALAAEAHEAEPGRPVFVRIEAGRGQAYVAGFGEDGAQTVSPSAVTLEEAERLARDPEGQMLVSGKTTADIITYARLGVDRLSSGAFEKPKPLYLRDADAKPQAAFALPRKAVP